MRAAESGLMGLALLVVEDEYLVAAELAQALEQRGASVIGPAATVSRAFELLACTARLDGALLDMQLRNERVFPLADALRVRAVPIVFVTGFDPEIIPEAYRGFPVCAKPLDLDALTTLLFPRSRSA
jgi:CheY-like chemotaxis protein